MKLLTTCEAADALGVPVHLVKKWKTLGLLTNHGSRKVNLWHMDELKTAEDRRQNPRLGWRGRPVTEAERQAEKRMRAGIVPTVPHSLPYRAFAFTCGKCGDMVSPTSIRRTDPRVLRRHRCDVEYVRQRRREVVAVAEADRASSREHYRSRQQASLPDAHRSGYDWTGPELEIAARTDLTTRQAAAMLGRTFAATMRARKNLSVDPRKQTLAGVRRGSRVD